MSNELDIAAVAKRANVTPATLRFYEQKGLIRPVGRNGLRRQYHPQVLQKLALIALGQVAGFTLDEIGGMFDAQGKMNLDRPQLQRQAQALDQRIQQLIKVRDGLQHVAQCPADDHLQCAEFQKILARAQNPQRAHQ